MESTDLLTIGDIQRELPSYRRHQINYALEAYDIEPVQRAGIVRLWTPEQLDAIRAALVRTTGRREVSHAK